MPRKPPVAMRDAKVESLEKRIQKLEEELYVARHFVIERLPEHLSGLMSDVIYGKRPQTGLIEKIVEATEPISAYERDPIGSPRAYCPLCDAGSTGWYGEAGYAIPEGLARHLTGYGNTRRCQVMEIVNALERSRREDTRKHEEATKRAEAERELKRLLSKEPRYKTGPECTGQLAEEVGWRYDGVRNARQMELVEGRLETMGFVVKIDGRVHSVTQAWGEKYVVYADARSVKKIDFKVYEGNVLAASFDLKEGVLEPKKKFEARMKKALALEPKREPTIEEERANAIYEPLFRIGPQCPGLLAKEARWYGARDWDDELSTRKMTERLVALGFDHRVDGRVNTFVQTLPVRRELMRAGWDDFVIYADPRMNDRVVYRVYLGEKRARPVSAVQVMDKWYESRDDLMGRLASTLRGLLGAHAIVEGRGAR